MTFTKYQVLIIDFNRAVLKNLVLLERLKVLDNNLMPYSKKDMKNAIFSYFVNNHITK